MQSKPGLRPESPVSPIISARHQIFSGGGGVLHRTSRDAGVGETEYTGGISGLDQSFFQSWLASIRSWCSSPSVFITVMITSFRSISTLRIRQQRSMCFASLGRPELGFAL